MIGSRLYRNLVHGDTLASHIGSSDFIDYIHAFEHLSKNRVFVVQPWGSADFFIFCNHFLWEALSACIDADFSHLGKQTRVAVICLYNEELAAVGARTGICHRESAAEVAQLNIELILKRSAPDAFAVPSGSPP